MRVWTMDSVRRPAAAVMIAALCASGAWSEALAQAPPSAPPMANAPPPASGPFKGFSLDEIDAVTGAASSIYDVAARWLGPKPAPTPQFGYSDSPGFDMQLHQSLGAKLPEVNVVVEGRFSSDQIPERMGNWLTQVRKRGGTVSQCVITENRSLLFFLQLFMRVLKGIDTWLMYRPAGDYNALMFVSAQGHQIGNILFIEKSQPQRTCPGGAAPLIVP